MFGLCEIEGKKNIHEFVLRTPNNTIFILFLNLFNLKKSSSACVEIL